MKKKSFAKEMLACLLALTVSLTAVTGMPAWGNDDNGNMDGQYVGEGFGTVQTGGGESPEIVNVMALDGVFSYDPQPISIEETQAAISAHQALPWYEAVKPRWQYEVGGSLMPTGYHCEFVDWDDALGVGYWTFFMDIVGVSNAISGYQALVDAIADPGYGDTIAIDGDITLEGTLMIDRSVTFTATGTDGFFTLKSAIGKRHLNVSGDGIVLTFKKIRLDGQSNGGGVELVSGDLKLKDAVIENCVNVNGGGVFVNPHTVLTVEGGKISDNKAESNTNSSDGGGIYANAAEVNVTGKASIDHNEAYNGGGISAFNGSVVTVKQGAVIELNTAGGYGGGIYVTHTNNGASGDPSEVVVDSSMIKNNTASSYGGGIANFGSTVTLEDSSVSYNKAKGGGGGISARYNNAALNISGCTIDGNTSGGNGGGIYGATNAVISISGNVISNNEAVDGGAIYVNSGELTMDKGIIKSNKAFRVGKTNETKARGGGIAVMGGAIANIYDDVQISANLAKVEGNIGDYMGMGGGIYVDGASVLNLGNGVTIGGDALTEGNTAHKGYGSGICFEGASKSVTIPSGVNITYNNANSSQQGGGVYAGDYITLVINGANISHNEISDGYYGDGGGVAVGNNAALTILDGAIDGNLAGRNGGGICADNQAIVTIEGGTVNDNVSNLNAGGIHAASTGKGGTSEFAKTSVLIMNGGEICGNTAANIVGGVYAHEFLMTGGKIEHNKSEGRTNNGGYAGGVMCHTFKMTGGSVSDNTVILPTYFGIGPGVVCSDFKMSGGEIKNNRFEQEDEDKHVYGGGVCMLAQHNIPGFGVDMSGGVISGNTADYGGGIGYWIGNGNLTDDNFVKISGGEISGNDARSGGGIVSFVKVDVGGTALISGNTAFYGGGIYSNGDITVSANAKFSDNEATSYGGAIYGSGNSDIAVSGHAAISGNKAVYGGGVFGNYAVEIFGDAEFSGNEATSYGGGIFGNNSSVITVSEQPKINGNKAGNGGGICGYGEVTILDDVEIGGNKADTSGGGVYIKDLTRLKTDGVDFRHNSAPAGYLWDLEDDEDSDTHRSNILNTTYTMPYSNAYNNFDVNYKERSTATLPETELETDVYSVIYNANGGSGGFTDTGIQSGEAYTVLSPGDTGVERTGYDFLGWNIAADGSDTAYNANETLYMLADDVILFAQWDAHVAPMEPDETDEPRKPHKPSNPGEIYVPGTPGGSANNNETETIIAVTIPQGMVRTDVPDVYQLLNENGIHQGYFSPETDENGDTEWIEVEENGTPFGTAAAKQNPATGSTRDSSHVVFPFIIGTSALIILRRRKCK